MRVFASAVVTAALTVCTTTVSFADTGDELFKLLPADGAAGDRFGWGVAISGTTAIVGATNDDDNGDTSGSAYLFDTATGQQVAKLLPSDGSSGDWFGESVAIDGSLAIVGAKVNDDGGNSTGSAYLFDTTTGQEVFKLLAGDKNKDDHFGQSVGISGTIAVIGAWGDDDNGGNSGSAYLFDVTNGQEIVKLLPSDAGGGDQFGVSVGVSGTTAIVGSYRHDDNGSDAGAAYLFDTITHQQIAVLLASDGAAGDNFGEAVSISGGIAIVGARLDDDNGDNSGSAYLFDATTGQQLAKLLPNDGAADECFGTSVAVSGNVAIVGAIERGESGSAYLFNVTTGQQIAKLLSSYAPDEFGIRVGVSGATAIVGADKDDDNGSDSGSAFLFDANILSLDSIDISRTRYDRTTGVTLNGYGFADGTGTTVIFDTIPATNVVVVDDTTITCDTPVVEPAQLNVDVTVSNGYGSDTLVDAFTFTPALQLSGNWVPGGDLTLTYLLDPNDSIFAIYGLPPVQGFDTPPFDGQLCIFPFYMFFILQNWPFDEWQYTFDIPNNPNLSGLEVLFQGLIGPEFGGRAKDAAWANCASLVIE